MTKFSVVLMGLFLFLSTATAADLTGRWRLDLNPNFGGMDQVLLCAVKQSEATISANCEGGQFTGRTDDSRITLQVKTGLKDEFTATFEGAMNQASTTISGSWHLTDSSGERTGKFTLTKR